MSRLVRIVSFVALIGLFAAAPVLRASAQDGSPAAGTSGAMSIEQTRAAIDAYLAALVAREDIAPYFADAVVLELVDVAQVIQGRDEVAGAIVALHEQTFDARPELTSLIVGEGTAAIEAVFVGVHTGKFVGIPASGKEVAVPYAVFYDLTDGEITALRIHGFASGLVAQLTAEATPAADSGEAADVAFETISAAPAESLPSAPAEAVLLRITLQPGAAVPAPDDPGASFTYVESGSATVRLDAPVGVGRDAQFETPEEEPFERVAAGTEFPVGPGDAFVIPPLTGGEIRNDGQELVVLLVTYLFSTGEAATLAAGTPAP